MQIQNVQNNNYHQNFNALIIHRKNPRISSEVRVLAEKADAFLDKCIETKTPNGVTINIGHRLEANGIRFKKTIDGKQAELRVKKNFGDNGTDLILKLKEQGEDESTVIWYNSDGWKSDLETIDAYLQRDSDREIIGPIKEYKTYAQKNAALKKYAEILLQDI